MSLTIHEVDQRSDEWLELRCGIVTASIVGQLITTKSKTAIDYDCPACKTTARLPCLSKRTKAPIATLHPERAAASREDKSPPALVMADGDTVRRLAGIMVAERLAGLDPDSDFVNRDMFRGIATEPHARDKYAEHYRVEVDEVGFLVLDQGDYRIGFSPDGLVGDDGLIEIKSPRRGTHVLSAVAGSVPAHHMAQIQTGLLVSGRKWCDFISYNGGMRMWVTRVTPDPAWFTAIHAAVAEFEQTVQQLTADYTAAVEGFPQTQWIDPDRVELKLA